MSTTTYILEREQRQEAETRVRAGVAVGWRAFYGTKMFIPDDDSISMQQVRDLFGFGSAEQIAKLFFHSTYFKSTSGERMGQLQKLTKILEPYKYLLYEIRKEHFNWVSFSVRSSFTGNGFRSATWSSDLTAAAVVYQFLVLLHRWETSEMSGELNQQSWDGVRDLTALDSIIKNHVLIKELFTTLGEATLKR